MFAAAATSTSWCNQQASEQQQQQQALFAGNPHKLWRATKCCTSHLACCKLFAISSRALIKFPLAANCALCFFFHWSLSDNNNNKHNNHNNDDAFARAHSKWQRNLPFDYSCARIVVVFAGEQKKLNNSWLAAFVSKVCTNCNTCQARESNSGAKVKCSLSFFHFCVVVVQLDYDRFVCVYLFVAFFCCCCCCCQSRMQILDDDDVK